MCSKQSVTNRTCSFFKFSSAQHRGHSQHGLALRRTGSSLASLAAGLDLTDRPQRRLLFGARQSRFPNVIAQHELLQQQELVS